MSPTIREGVLGSEQTSIFPDRHVAVLRTADVVLGMAAAFEWLGSRFRETVGSAVLVTGPSKTADMDELVLGAHGPKEAHMVIVFEDLGYDELTSETEFCGMAGSSGYKTEYYELSIDVGELLREQFSGDKAGERTVVASGTSCMEQPDTLLSRPTQHPVELVSPR